MDDRAIIFFSIVMILVFLYRVILSALLLRKKRHMIDEKFYIGLFYCSLVSILVLFTNWLIVGIVLIAILPIVLTLYVSFAPTRMYWIINGYDITESTFVNKLIEYDEQLKKTSYRINKVRISRKTKEKKTKIEFLNVKFEEKEQLLKIFKEILNEKVGHTGTLDPNATGVLPLLVGKGTQISKYLINHDKTYEAVLKLGEKTDTADSEGQVIETKDVQEANLEKGYVEQVLKSLIGKQEQIPPMYSAIKVNGKKLYEYARNGQTVDIDPRIIEIYSLELINIENFEIIFKVQCSKGTYIRTLCEQIAEKLGTVGYMKELKRTQVGEFYIEKSITIEELEQNVEKYFITIENYFQNYNSINLNTKKLQLFLNGVQLTQELEDGIYKIYSDERFVGIGTIKNNLLKRDIVIDK